MHSCGFQAWSEVMCGVKIGIGLGVEVGFGTGVRIRVGVQVDVEVGSRTGVRVRVGVRVGAEVFGIGFGVWSWDGSCSWSVMGKKLPRQRASTHLLGT